MQQNIPEAKIVAANLAALVGCVINKFTSRVMTTLVHLLLGLHFDKYTWLLIIQMENI